MALIGWDLFSIGALSGALEGQFLKRAYEIFEYRGRSSDAQLARKIARETKVLPLSLGRPHDAYLREDDASGNGRPLPRSGKTHVLASVDFRYEGDTDLWWWPPEGFRASGLKAVFSSSAIKLTALVPRADEEQLETIIETACSEVKQVLEAQKREVEEFNADLEFKAAQYVRGERELMRRRRSVERRLRALRI